MQAFLKKHGQGAASHIVKVEWEQKQQDDLLIHFTVQKRLNRPWLSDASFTQDWSKNWGLWEKDVLEAFFQLRRTSSETKAPYLELQLSPLNQPFALLVTGPRKTFYSPPKLELFHEVQIIDQEWKATLGVRLPDELRGNNLFGSFFACLDEGPREFYALTPNPEDVPDFHRPELFMPLRA